MLHVSSTGFVSATGYSRLLNFERHINQLIDNMRLVGRFVLYILLCHTFTFLIILVRKGGVNIQYYSDTVQNELEKVNSIISNISVISYPEPNNKSSNDLSKSWRSLDINDISDVTELNLINLTDWVNCSEEFKVRFTNHCEQLASKMFAGISPTRNGEINYCPCLPPTLVGVKWPDKSRGALDRARPALDQVKHGGHWSPTQCSPRQRVAVIIPFRDRMSHLNILLANLHAFLQRQQLEYRFFVVEQDNLSSIFNKAMIMNGAFLEVLRGRPKVDPAYSTTPSSRENPTTSDSKTSTIVNISNNQSLTVRSDTDNQTAGGIKPPVVSVQNQTSYLGDATTADSSNQPVSVPDNANSESNERLLEVTDEGRLWDSFDCYIFHDVDMLPENDYNIYTCTNTPRHVGAYVDKFSYNLLYVKIFGGVTAFTENQFKKVNGFSNEFYGYGGEDDDMRNRIESRNMSVVRFPQCVAKYTMISHNKDKGNPYNINSDIAWQTRTSVYDANGLNNVKYSVVRWEERPLYTWILVSVPPPPLSFNNKFVIFKTNKGKR